MITLEAADLIEGDASAANVVDYTINGVQEASSVVSLKALADGQLPASKGTLYTTPASTTAIVKSVILVNTASSARTINLYVQRDGSNSRRIIPEDLSLEANGGSAILADQLYVFSAAGELLYKVSCTAHASKHTTGAADEVDGDKLDIDWNPSNYTPATTPSEADNVDNLAAHLYGIDQGLGQKLENVVEDTTPQLGGDLDCQNNRFTNMLGFLMKAVTELTISSGAVTVTQMFHTIDTEGDAATDDLDTINGGSTVNMIVIRSADDARTVVVKHNTGNIWLQGKADISLDDLEDGLLLVWDGTKWFDIAAGGGGGGGGLDLTTKGDLHTYDTDDAALGVGSNEQRLEADSAESKGIKWAWPTKLRNAGGDKVEIDSNGIVSMDKQSRFAARRSTQSLPTGVYTTITNYGTEYFDEQNEFNVTTGIFQPSVNGHYNLAAWAVLVSLADGKKLIVEIRKNGSSIAVGRTTAGAADYIGQSCAWTDYLLTTDQIILSVYHNHGSNRDVTGALSAHRAS